MPAQGDTASRKSPRSHPRKSIVFAVSERQAVIVERLFNKLLPDAACLRIVQWPLDRSPRRQSVSAFADR